VAAVAIRGYRDEGWLTCTGEEEGEEGAESGGSFGSEKRAIVRDFEEF
jgi:hypothetical protein